MGNSSSKRSDQLAALYEKFNDPELTRLDLRYETVAFLPFLSFLLQPRDESVSLPMAPIREIQAPTSGKHLSTAALRPTAHLDGSTAP